MMYMQNIYKPATAKWITQSPFRLTMDLERLHIKLYTNRIGKWVFLCKLVCIVTWT
jgi:hypothetical protein